MLRVGLTGGLACGKSTVARMFAERGLHVLEADLLAHELIRPGKRAYEAIVHAFGPGILSGDAGSAIDRAKLAALVFDPKLSRLDELNAITHPEVIREQEQWLETIARDHPQGIAVVEAALIFEAGVRGRFDQIVVVVCDHERKLARYGERVLTAVERNQGPLGEISRGQLLMGARADAQRRIATQISDEEKRKRADYVIENNGGLAELAEKAGEVVWALREAVER